MFHDLSLNSDIPTLSIKRHRLSGMEEDERREFIEEAMKYHERNKHGSNPIPDPSGSNGWSEFAFKVIFPMASAVVASVARALCEHFLGG